MIAHGPENVFYCGRDNLRRGGAVPSGADLHGLAHHDRGLVDTDVGELDRSRRRRGPRFSRVETRSIKLGPPQLAPYSYRPLVPSSRPFWGPNRSPGVQRRLQR
jgi:hypothetical protein